MFVWIYVFTFFGYIPMGGIAGLYETQVQFLGWKDSLEKEMATHSSTLA